MERPTTTMLRIGAWCVNPASGQISRDGETSRVEVRTMRLLMCLAERAGEVVSINELLNKVWSDVTVSPDSVYQAVTSLRRVLGDDPKQPAYIETVPRLGYRMVATVTPATACDEAVPANALELPTESTSQLRPGFAWAIGGLICFALVATFLFYRKAANGNLSASPAVASQQQKSIAVLPFLDLTNAMSEEPFADGMTEELIDKLSKIPGIRVPSATSSFYFKSKLWPRSHGNTQITIADIAKQLGVTYVLDGSIRKSGARVRVDARLILASNGFVVWSETYDRPFDDILMVQEDIAGEVTKALKTSIESGSDR